MIIYYFISCFEGPSLPFKADPTFLFSLYATSQQSAITPLHVLLSPYLPRPSKSPLQPFREKETTLVHLVNLNKTLPQTSLDL